LSLIAFFKSSVAASNASTTSLFNSNYIAFAFDLIYLS